MRTEGFSFIRNILPENKLCIKNLNIQRTVFNCLSFKIASLDFYITINLSIFKLI